MTELIYISDEQIVADAAQMLLENHLSWSGSNESLPSKDLGGVRGLVVKAYVGTAKKNGVLGGEDGERFWSEMAVSLFKQAAKIADRKWMAAMTLLGIEQ